MAARRAIEWAEWRANWTLVLACAVGFSFSALLTYAFGVFLVPISEEFGWSRAETSIGVTLNGIVSVLLSPVVGMMIGRWGVRRIAVPGLLLLSLSIAAFALSSGSIGQWIFLWSIYALVDLAVKSTVWTTAVAYAFEQERSLAIAVTLTGVSVALVIGPPLAATLVGALGWRQAFVALGLGWGAVSLAVAIPLLRDVRPDRPRRAAAAGTAESVDAGLPGELDVRQAFRSRPIQFIALSTLLTMLLGIAVQVHQVPILMSGGLTLQKSAYLVGLGGMAGIGGKLVTGWLMDRFDPGTVGALTLALSAAAFVLLLDRFRTVPLAIAALMMIGYASAAKMQICAYLTSRYVGMRSFAVVFGFMSSLIALGGGLGPLMAGLIFDHFRTYDPLLALASAGTAFAAGLLLTLRRFPLLPAEYRPLAA